MSIGNETEAELREAYIKSYSQYLALKWAVGDYTDECKATGQHNSDDCCDHHRGVSAAWNRREALGGKLADKIGRHLEVPVDNPYYGIYGPDGDTTTGYNSPLWHDVAGLPQFGSRTLEIRPAQRGVRIDQTGDYPKGVIDPMTWAEFCEAFEMGDLPEPERIY